MGPGSDPAPLLPMFTGQSEAPASLDQKYFINSSSSEPLVSQLFFAEAGGFEI